MNNVPRITEIDISKQARALAWLRKTDFALVVPCGYLAICLLGAVVVSFPSADAGIELIALLVLCFLTYTGWRHVGVIDPSVWRTYRVLFPLLVVLCLFGVGVAWYLLAESGSGANITEEAAETEFGAVVLMVALAWIGSVALLDWISLIRLRRRKITAMGATIEQVLLRLVKNAGVTVVRATDIRRINKPLGLIHVTAGALLLVGYMIPPMLNNKKLADAMQKSSFWLIMSGLFLLVRARRYFQIDADSLLAADRRSPILFLRSFGDDEKQKYFRPFKALLDFSLETRFSNHFSRFGPFIAIGSPMEGVPQPGAARVLLSDEEWQPRVLSWMRDARLIIMYSGRTHWVNWELRQVVKNECATRLILMIPEIKARMFARKEEISARVEQVREEFKGSPWEEELLCFNDFARLRAMLFRPDGSMIMVKSRSHSRDSYHLAALVAHHILIDSDALNHKDENVRIVEVSRAEEVDTAPGESP